MADQSLHNIFTTFSSQSNHRTISKSILLHNPFLGSVSSCTPTAKCLTTLCLRPHHRSTWPTTFASTVVSSLPTSKPERNAGAEKTPQWSWRVLKSFTMAELEARKLKHPSTGTEALLMGILVEGTSLASKFLRANGIGLLKIRDEAAKLRGKADIYYFPPERPPLTKEAQRAVDWAVDHKLKSGDNGEVTTSDLLLGIWSEVESPGHKIMANLGFDDEKAKELEKLSSGSDFLDG